MSEVTKQFEELAMITSMSECKPINEVQEEHENDELEARGGLGSRQELKEEAKKSESASSDRQS